MFTGLQGWTDGIRALLDVDAPEYPDSKIQEFLFAGEVQLNRHIRTRRNEKLFSGTSSSGLLTLPEDFEEMRNIYAPNSNRSDKSVELLSPDEFYNQTAFYSPNDPDPVFGMIVGDTLKLAPAVSADLDLMYYYTVPHLQDDSDPTPADQTTIFTQHYPDALLYASAINAAPYMIDDVRITIWQGALDQILNDIKENKPKEHYGSAPLKRRIRIMG